MKLRRFKFLILILTLIFTLSFVFPSTLIADQASDVKAFVTRLYETCLGRSPDPEGLENWTQGLLSGEVSAGQAAYGFVFSDELVSKNLNNEEFLQVMYAAFFGRSPDPVGFNDWLGQLNSGMNREEVFSHFVDSNEFRDICSSYGIEVGSTKINERSENGQNSNEIKIDDDKIRGSEEFTELILTALTILAYYDPEVYSQYQYVDEIIETPHQGALGSTDGEDVFIDLSNREFTEIPFEATIACTLSHEFNHIMNIGYYQSTGDRYGMEIKAFQQEYNTAYRIGMPNYFLDYLAWVIDNIYSLYKKSTINIYDGKISN